MVGERAADRRRHLRFDPLDGVAAVMDEGQRERLALAFDARRVAEQAAEPLAVERRRHGEDAQVGAQRGSGVERERETEVAVEAALVNLVEQHRRHAAEFGIGLQPGEEYAVGHRDQASVAADLAIEPGGVADRGAWCFAALAGDILGGGAGGEAARDEQQHLARAPWLIEQRRRDAGGLARSGRRDQQRARPVAQSSKEVGQDRVDRQRGAHNVTKVAKAAKVLESCAIWRNFRHRSGRAMNKTRRDRSASCACGRIEGCRTARTMPGHTIERSASKQSGSIAVPTSASMIANVSARDIAAR